MMKLRNIFVSLALVTIAVATAQGKLQAGKAKQQGRVSRVVIQENKKLAMFIGSWNTVWKNWEKPDTQPDVINGKAVFKWSSNRALIQGAYSGKFVLTKQRPPEVGQQEITWSG